MISRDLISLETFSRCNMGENEEYQMEGSKGRSEHMKTISSQISDVRIEFGMKIKRRYGIGEVINTVGSG